MIAKHSSFPPEELVPRIIALLDECEVVPLVITGESMTPFLTHERDTVYLSKPDRPLKKGDMIFYRRNNGQYILHRICQVGEDQYWLVGDGQCSIEPGIRPDQVIALVTAVRRNGKLLKPDSLCWQFFEKIWLHTVPFRPYYLKLHSIFHR